MIIFFFKSKEFLNIKNYVDAFDRRDEIEAGKNGANTNNRVKVALTPDQTVHVTGKAVKRLWANPS